MPATPGPLGGLPCHPPSTPMKTLLRATVGALALAVVTSTLGCQTDPVIADSHWNIDSLDNRIIKHATGYRGPIDGSYTDYQWKKEQSIYLTLRRHLLNNDPTNPLEPDDPSVTSPRPAAGLLPDPERWVGNDTVAIAVATVPLWDYVLPIRTFSGSSGRDKDQPPPVKAFRVKNR